MLVKGGLLVSETGERKADILVQNGKIVGLGPDIVSTKDVEVVDAEGMLVLPGIIDVHTHFGLVNARGQRTADDFFQGSISAACGGVTTVIDYAEPVPGESLLAAAIKRRREAEGSIAVDFALHVVVASFSADDAKQLSSLVDYGITSVGEIFTSHPTLKIDRADLRRLMECARDVGVLVTMHAEDDDVLAEAQGRLRAKGQLDKSYHGLSRPIEAEERAIAWLIQMAKEVMCPLYMVHVSSGEGCKLIAEARHAGLEVMGETCPHYLLLTEDEYQGENAGAFIMNPPLRRQVDNQLLWEGIKSGALQVVTTDHCSYTPEQKNSAKTWCDVLPGVPGVETLLPLLYSEGVGKGRLQLRDLVRILATNPARIFGLYPQKGVLEIGSDADMVIFDPNHEVTLVASTLHSAADYTPFEGWHVRGYPKMTIVRGKVIYDRGIFCGDPTHGSFVKAKKGVFV